MQLNDWYRTELFMLNRNTWISIIHPRCIKVGLQWCTVFITDFGFFCIILAPTATPAWLWKSQAASLIATCYACASTKAIIIIGPDFGRSYRHLSFSNSQWKTGHFTLLYYIIPSLPHLVSTDYFQIQYRGKMVFLILVHIHDLHFNKTYTYPTPNLSYTNTSKLTWNKPLL